MKPGAILTKRETEAIQKRLTAIGRSTSDRRTKEQCRLAQVAIINGARRAARYQREEGALLYKIESTL